VIFAVAFMPEPPVSDTPAYVPDVPPDPATRFPRRPSMPVPVVDTADTGTENPEPEPPRLAAVADNVSPTEKWDPGLLTEMLATTPPDTTIVAFAPKPLPPVKGTFVYVALT
jgi:hypothetical protein